MACPGDVIHLSSRLAWAHGSRCTDSSLYDGVILGLQLNRISNKVGNHQCGSLAIYFRPSENVGGGETLYIYHFLNLILVLN
jgi:hypothetical protein